MAHQPNEFYKGLNILLTHKDFHGTHKNKPGYITAFKIFSYHTLNDPLGGKKYNPLDEGLLDASNVSGNFNYFETKMNLEKKTFLEAIKN